MFFWPRSHQMHRTANEEGANKASHAGHYAVPNLCKVGSGFQGVPDERESAETVEEQQGRGEQSAAARTQTATARPSWRRMFGR
jgi:hypothetical protein